MMGQDAPLTLNVHFHILEPESVKSPGIASFSLTK